jgi:hypothetical protein
VVLLLGKGSGATRASQQSVQPTGGILRRFRAFFWLRAFSCSRSESQPAHQRLTQTVGQVGIYKVKRLQNEKYNYLPKLWRK